MSTINDGGPAYPCEQHETLSGTWNQTFAPGMSLRDFFAAAALQGLLAEDASAYSFDNAAAAAYQQADAMLAKRAKVPA